MPIDMDTAVVSMSQRLARVETSIINIEGNIKRIETRLAKASDKRLQMVLSLGGWATAIAIALSQWVLPQ